MPNTRYAVAAGEEIGRPMVELTEQHFVEFYGYDIVNEVWKEGQVAISGKKKRKRASGSSSAAAESTLLQRLTR